MFAVLSFFVSQFCQDEQVKRGPGYGQAGCLQGVFGAWDAALAPELVASWRNEQLLQCSTTIQKLQVLVDGCLSNAARFWRLGNPGRGARPATQRNEPETGTDKMGLGT